MEKLIGVLRERRVSRHYDKSATLMYRDFYHLAFV